MTTPHEQIINHLKAHQPAQALKIIESRSWDDSDIHIISWKAQALMQMHHYQKALYEIISGIRASKKLKNTEAEKSLRQLQKDCTDKLIAMRSAQATDGPLSEGLNLIKSGRIEQGRQNLSDLRDKADSEKDIKMSVLVRLALAEIEDQRIEALEEATQIADQSNDQNLIAAVVRTKKLHGIPIKPFVF